MAAAAADAEFYRPFESTLVQLLRWRDEGLIEDDVYHAQISSRLESLRPARDGRDGVAALLQQLKRWRDAGLINAK